VWKPRLTPGTSAARFANCRPLRGRFSIWVPVTSSPTPESFTSTSGASAMTVTSSVFCATVILNSTLVVAETFTDTPLAAWGENPVRVDLTS
jgi:hypothetical protein